MTVIRLDLQAGGWRAVPPRMLEDERLSLDTRGVAAYIATRSDSFCLSVGGLCTLLRIGEDKWKRMNAELKTTGYLKHTERRDECGRFKHELLFSPIPEGGFPEKLSIRSSTPTRKSRVEPAPANPGSAQPHTVLSGSTRDRFDQISDDHHQAHGGGTPETIESTPPTMPIFWTEAANYEISIEKQKRQVKNRDGLLKTILNRYRANGGPSNAVMQALEATKAADVLREARTSADHERTRRESESSHANALRHSQAEAKARAMDQANRLTLILVTQGAARLKASKTAKDAFVDHGEILHGALCRALVDSLISQ